MHPTWCMAEFELRPELRGVQGSHALNVVHSGMRTNTNALNLVTFNGIAPHAIPLPSGERDG